MIDFLSSRWSWKRFGNLLGSFWILLGVSWAALGGSWSLFGELLGDPLEVLSRLEALQNVDRADES